MPCLTADGVKRPLVQENHNEAEPGDKRQKTGFTTMQAVVTSEPTQPPEKQEPVAATEANGSVHHIAKADAAAFWATLEAKQNGATQESQVRAANNLHWVDCIGLLSCWTL